MKAQVEFICCSHEIFDRLYYDMRSVFLEVVTMSSELAK